MIACPNCGHKIGVKRGMTAKQSETLAFIKAYSKKHKRAPSYQEIVKAVGIKSKSGAHRLVKSLIERNVIVAQTREYHATTHLLPRSLVVL